MVSVELDDTARRRLLRPARGRERRAGRARRPRRRLAPHEAGPNAEGGGGRTGGRGGRMGPGRFCSPPGPPQGAPCGRQGRPAPF